MSTAPGQGDLLAQLRQSLGLLQVAFDAASEAMLILDPTGLVRWGNQAAGSRGNRAGPVYCTCPLRR